MISTARPHSLGFRHLSGCRSEASCVKGMWLTWLSMISNRRSMPPTMVQVNICFLAGPKMRLPRWMLL